MVGMEIVREWREEFWLEGLSGDDDDEVVMKE